MIVGQDGEGGGEERLCGLVHRAALSADVSSGQIHPELLLLLLPSLSGCSAEEAEEERDEEQPGTVAAGVCGGAPSRLVLFYIQVCKG